MKKGKVYIMMLCGFTIGIFILSLVILYQQYQNNDVYGVTKDIGSKQGAILKAVREGERIQLYVQEAKNTVSLQAGVTNPCGEDYLFAKMIGTGGCDDPLSTQVTALNGLLASYPGGPLTDITWTQKPQDNGLVTLEGIKTIPVGFAKLPSQTFTGIYDGWPTQYKRTPNVFGYRQIDVVGATIHHPGLDISANGNVGEPVMSLGDGEAQFYLDNSGKQNNYIKVTQADGLIIKYTHVIPATNIQGAVVVQQASTIHVQKSQVIGMTAEYRGGPHVHLEVIYPGITPEMVRTLWSDHVSYSDDTQSRDDYAVLSHSSNTVYLNPICFFDRTMITQILQESSKLNQDTFTVCEEYQNNLHLSEKFAKAASSQSTQTPPTGTTQSQAGAQVSTSPTGQTTQPTSQTPGQSASPTPGAIQPSQNAPPQVAITEGKLNQLGLMPAVADAAQQEGISTAALLAIITQENIGDPNAVSCTGAVGLGQFTSGTAKGYSDIFSRVQPCCAPDGVYHACSNGNTCCPENQRACADPAVRLCQPNNDDRFDPAKSIRGMARLHKANSDHYKSYQQQDAFAFASYNGGTCIVDKALTQLKQAGKDQPTWDDVKTTMLGLPPGLCLSKSGLPPDIKQITNYVDKVLPFYEAWGGKTISGTPFTSTNLGYYDIRLVVPDVQPSELDAPLRALQEAVKQCTTQDCIRQVIQDAQTAVTLSHETLITTPQGGSCFTAEERAQIYLGEQMQQCKDSPESLCSCPISTAIDASYEVSPNYIKLTKLNGKNIADSAVDTLEGTALPAEGDSGTQDKVTYKDDFTTTPGIAQDSVKFNLRDKSLNFVAEFDQHAAAFYKQDDGLIFLGQTTETCVMPPEPLVYCMKSKTDSNKRIGFFINMQANSNPAADTDNTPTQVVVQSHNGMQKITWKGKAFPYAHIQLILGDTTVDQYLNVHDMGQKTRDELDADAVKNIFSALRSAIDYETVMPVAPGTTVTVTLMDENLKETQPATYVYAGTDTTPGTPAP